MNNYTSVPNWLFERDDLPQHVKWVYARLLYLCKDGPYIERSNTLAFGISTHITEYELLLLKEKGLITYRNDAVYYSVAITSKSSEAVS